MSTRCSCSLVDGRAGPGFPPAWAVVDGPLAGSGADVETLRDEVWGDAWLGSVCSEVMVSGVPGRAGATGAADRRDIEASTSMPRAC